MWRYFTVSGVSLIVGGLGGFFANQAYSRNSISSILFGNGTLNKNLNLTLKCNGETYPVDLTYTIKNNE